MSQTSESSKTCGRCGEPIHAVVARVAIESGPLHASHPVLDLCAGCSESMERWLARRGRSRRGSGGSHSHRHGGFGEPAMYASPSGQDVTWAEGERGRQMVIAMVVLATFVVGLFLVLSIAS